MACRPKTEIEADLIALNDAYRALITGKSVRSLTVGSDDLQRRYSFQEINSELLKEELSRVRRELADCYGDAEGSGVGTSFDYSRRHNLVVVRNP